MSATPERHECRDHSACDDDDPCESLDCCARYTNEDNCPEWVDDSSSLPLREDHVRAGEVSVSEAREILSMFVRSHFHNRVSEGPTARFSIPADPKRDSDIRLGAFIARASRDMESLARYRLAYGGLQAPTRDVTALLSEARERASIFEAEQRHARDVLGARNGESLVAAAERVVGGSGGAANDALAKIEAVARDYLTWRRSLVAAGADPVPKVQGRLVPLPLVQVRHPIDEDV